MGFANDGTSCFLDSLIVALFWPEYNGYFDSMFLSNSVLQQMLGDDGQECSWEQSATPHWRQAMFDGLTTAVRELRDGTCTTLQRLRSLCAQVPQNELNFGAQLHQSAVDVLRYLLHVFKVRDRVVQVQQSVTMLKSRRAVVQAGDNVSELMRLWMQQPLEAKYTHANAHDLPDAEERLALLRDSSGQAYVTYTSVGDMRRVSAPEWASLFVCQLTTQDANSEAVRIERELLPQVEVLTGQEGYDGSVATKVTATRLVYAPVLVFEVARKMIRVTPQGVQEFKLPTPVTCGAWNTDGAVTLQVGGSLFSLRAVVCHSGSTDSGHYTASVWKDGRWWVYDDATMQRFIATDDLKSVRLTVEQCGELFFYVRV